MTRRLDSITIQRFRGIQGMTLADLGQINLIVGANNSGKTSALEAIAIHCRPLDPLHYVRVATMRDIAGAPQVDALKWLFPQQGAGAGATLYQGEVRISSTGPYVVRESSAAFEEN